MSRIHTSVRIRVKPVVSCQVKKPIRWRTAQRGSKKKVYAIQNDPLKFCFGGTLHKLLQSQTRIM